MDAFEATWGERFPMIVDSWRQRWSEISAFLAFPPELRKVIYTTNAIEAAHRQVRKTIKSRGHFPTDDAARKLISRHHVDDVSPTQPEFITRKNTPPKTTHHSTASPYL